MQAATSSSTCSTSRKEVSYQKLNFQDLTEISWTGGTSGNSTTSPYISNSNSDPEKLAYLRHLKMARPSVSPKDCQGLEMITLRQLNDCKKITISLVCCFKHMCKLLLRLSHWTKVMVGTWDECMISVFNICGRFKGYEVRAIWGLCHSGPGDEARSKHNVWVAEAYSRENRRTSFSGVSGLCGSKSQNFRVNFSRRTETPLPVVPTKGNVHMNCIMCCASKPPLYMCREFRSLPSEQWMEIVRKWQFCYNCLQPGQVKPQCKSDQTCTKCEKPHHTLLHQKLDRDTGTKRSERDGRDRKRSPSAEVDESS